MASLSDVEAGVVESLSKHAFFVGGNVNTAAAFTRSSIVANGVAVPIRIARGWPSPSDVSTAVNSGCCLVSVWPVPNTSQDTNRFQSYWGVGEKVPINLNAIITANTVTFSGYANAGVVAGIGYEGAGYSYRANATIQAPDFAAALAATIPNATVSGSTVTLATNAALEAPIGSDATMLREMGRQTQRISIITWAPSPEVRDIVGEAVRLNFAVHKNLWLKYGYVTEIMKYVGDSVHSMEEREGIYRRDTTFNVEYATHQVLAAPSILFLGINTTGRLSGTFPSGGPQPFTW